MHIYCNMWMMFCNNRYLPNSETHDILHSFFFKYFLLRRFWKIVRYVMSSGFFCKINKFLRAAQFQWKKIRVHQEWVNKAYLFVEIDEYIRHGAAKTQLVNQITNKKIRAFVREVRWWRGLTIAMYLSEKLIKKSFEQYRYRS